MSTSRVPAYQLRFAEDGSVRVAGRSGVVLREDQYRIGDHLFDRFFSSCFGPALADVIEVGMAVYTADRVCARGGQGADRYSHGWSRRLSITIPVRRPDVWNSDLLKDPLRELLIFLTDDEWDFTFVRHGGSSRAMQGELFTGRPRRPRRVALFSGGLDSLAGLSHELLEFPESSFVLVSGWTHGRLRTRQGTLSREIQRITGRRIVPVQIPFGLRHGNSRYEDDERTQRTRGFVHGIFGAAVALALGENSLACYENGIGSLNLPLNAAQLGTHNARSAHPIALEELASFIELATDRPFSIHLPFLLNTKGQICRAIRAIDAAPLVSETVSCDSFPLRVPDTPQCGACTSCLLRRQALKVAGLQEADPAGGYAADVHAALDPDDELWWYLQVMLGQVESFRRALAAPVPWIGLARAFPFLDQTVLALAARGWHVARLREGIVDLFREYCAEWERFEQQSLPFVA